MPAKIFTIGHSNLSFMRFVTLIQDSNINHIIDIRSIPYSRRAPWSNKSRLPDLLRPYKIRYTYLGHKLGGKKQSIQNISRQQDVTPEEIYQTAVQTLIQLCTKDNLVLLCSESAPEHCHRQRIVAQTLLDSEIEVVHILKTGSLKNAWREEAPVQQAGLFQSTP
jgi:uncharacterized protein (DUF488 family)